MVHHHVTIAFVMNFLKKEDVGIDLKERKLEYQIACEDGNPEACHGLAEYYQLIEGDEKKSMELFRRNCDPPSNSLHRRFCLVWLVSFWYDVVLCVF